MGKGLLIIILGSIMMLGVVSITFVKASRSGSDNALEYYENIQARNMGNSMVNMLLSKLADDSGFRKSSFADKSFMKGDLEYRVVDTALTEGDTLVKIQVIANYNGQEKYITTFTEATSAAGWVPPVVRAAWTANGDMNNTISDMYIDGRDHALDLSIVPGTGLPAVSLSKEFHNYDGAALGGTYEGVDYRLSNPEDPDIIEEFFTWGGSFPKSPDEILGYPEGTLKELAKSGVGGGQFLKMKDEENIDEVYLDFPLSGVTYIEIKDDIERNLIMKGPGNEGLLIVHGPGAGSRLKGLKIEPWVKTKKPKVKDGDPWEMCHHPGEETEESMTVPADEVEEHLDHGDMAGFCPDPETDSLWFKGLIVTDFSFHHHLDILGAVVQLSENLETDKRCNGNQDHWVKYSSAAIKEATQFTAENTGLVGNSTEVNYSSEGFGNGRQKSTYWFE